MQPAAAAPPAPRHGRWRARALLLRRLPARTPGDARGDAGLAAGLLVRLGLAVFFAMNVMMMSMPSYVPYLYGGTGVAIDGPLFVVLRVLAGCFAVPVLAILGGPIAASAVASLRDGRPGSDVLVMLAVAAAFGLSAANVLDPGGEVYFDTAVMLLVLVTAGRYLEARARSEAGQAIRAAAVPLPERAVRVVAGRREEVPVGALAAGDVVEVAPGEAIPTDGVVIAGEASVDESSLSGESRPVVKTAGAAVAGGTCSIDGRLRVAVTAPASASAAARIEALVDAARRERSPAERTADRVAALLVPLVLGLAAGAGAFWTARAGIDQGVLIAVAVLVVACPCALGIATPVVASVGLAAAARRGVVVRSAAVLERVADAARVVFDKTGTLTEAEPRLVAIRLARGAGIDEGVLLARAAEIEHGLSHPLARAIASAARERGIVADASAVGVRVLPGRGVAGDLGGASLYVGRPGLRDEGLLGADARMDREATVAVVRADGRALGALSFAEEPRSGARPAVVELERLGVAVTVLSGDRTLDAIVPAIVARDAVEGGLLPEDKVRRLRELRAATSRDAAVLMVGDGINDTPALAAADVGVAVAGATDLARITADVVVLSPDLTAVPWLVVHARRVRRLARQNIAWAFGYNAVAVALAAAGALTPLVAALAMLASSFAVLANTRRLRADLGSSAAPAAGAVPLAPAGTGAVSPRLVYASSSKGGSEPLR